MIVKVSSKGMVTIPELIRKRLGISAGSKVDFKIVKNSVFIEPVTDNVDITKLKGILRPFKKATDSEVEKLGLEIRLLVCSTNHLLHFALSASAA